MVLAVNPVNLQTDIIPTRSVDFFQFVPRDRWRHSPFRRGLSEYAAQPCPLQNDGLVQADATVEGSFLTVDLCPSRKPFEKRLFVALLDLWQDSPNPAPVGIAVTGAWAAAHEDALRWLQDQARGNKLDITWINHSFSHPYDRFQPLEKTFLLTPGTDFRREVLATEIMLIERDILPSVFFRFPGLVSNCRLMARLKKLSLIPVGSRAWLAKGEAPVTGSIILVHGNGNEPLGIDLLLDLFRSGRIEFTAGNLRLRPLQDAIANPAAH